MNQTYKATKVTCSASEKLLFRDGLLVAFLGREIQLGKQKRSVVDLHEELGVPANTKRRRSLLEMKNI